VRVALRPSALFGSANPKMESFSYAVDVAINENHLEKMRSIKPCQAEDLKQTADVTKIS
jgi:hypothetical protein